MKNSSKIIGAVVLLLAGVAVYFYETSDVKVTTPKAPEPVVDNTLPVTVSTTTQTTPTKSGKYKNGSYNLTDTYFTPAGREQIGVSIVVAGDKIASAVVTGMAKGGDSKMYQMRFINKFSSQAVGMNLDGLKIDTSSGASLTTGAFNDALTQIRKQALN